MPVAALFQTKRPSYARHRSLYLVSFVLVVLLCLATLSFTPAHAANTRSSRAKDRVLASDIQILTLYKNKYTTGKRSRPVPQLKCTNTGIEKPLCKDPAALPDVVQCRQVGLNAAGEPQWKCEAELEDLYKFGTTDVTCEGYDYPEDPYVLVGSCGVEYTILKTQKWFERERDRGAGRGRESYRASDDSGNSWWDTLFGASHSPSSPHYDPYPERATREPKITHWLRSLLPFGLGALIPDFGLDPIAWLGLRHKFPFSLIFGSGAGYRGYNDDDSSYAHSNKTGFSLPRLIWYIVLGLFIYSVYQFWFQPRRPTQAGRPNRGSGGNGGGGGGGRYDPYDHTPGKDDGTYTPPRTGRTGTGSFFTSPLFTLGLGALLGNMRNRNRPSAPPSSSSYRSSRRSNVDEDDYVRDDSWAGARARGRGAASSSSSGYPASASGSSSRASAGESVRTTAGYGSTKRR